MKEIRLFLARPLVGSVHGRFVGLRVGLVLLGLRVGRREGFLAFSADGRLDGFDFFFYRWTLRVMA